MYTIKTVLNIKNKRRSERTDLQTVPTKIDVRSFIYVYIFIIYIMY